MIDYISIESIEHLDIEDDVYDIINYEALPGGDGVYLDEGHFLVDSIIVHNCVPDYIRRRDDENGSWRSEEHPEVAELLKDTRGLLIFQEQLQAIWQKFAGFTAPEAEAARKAVAKKWAEKLKPIGDQWLAKAAETLGPYTGPVLRSDDGRPLPNQPKTWAEFYWPRQQTFGRYAFNKSHSCAYVMVAWLSAWLKVYFPSEWWAAVMSTCDHEKMVKYMNIARSEGVKFGAINVENISINFTVDPATLMVTPGLTSIKGIGDSVANKIKLTGRYNNIDEFVEINGKNKTVMQRLILLGAFQRYHKNIRATWMWYQYKYCSDVTELKNGIRGMLLKDWTEEKIAAERERQTNEFKLMFPKRTKIPSKIINWRPKPTDDRESVMALFPIDFNLTERLSFEKQYLGYYWHSPMDLYSIKGTNTIKAARECETEVIEVILDKILYLKTKKDKPYARLMVSDGLNNCIVFMWDDELRIGKYYLKEGKGVRLRVDYDPDRGTFMIKHGTIPEDLMSSDNNQVVS